MQCIPLFKALSTLTNPFGLGKNRAAELATAIPVDEIDSLQTPYNLGNTKRRNEGAMRRVLFHTHGPEMVVWSQIL